jgi:hypothetical protein
VLVLIAVLAALVPPPPCAGCVTWRAAPDVARALLATGGTLEGLDLVVAMEDGAALDVPSVRGLAARGATVGLELPLGEETDLAPLADVVTRVLLRLPAGAVAGEALVYRVRTQATSVRAALPGAVVGLAGDPEVLSALARADLRPYASVMAASGPAPVRVGAASAFEWWSRTETHDSVEDVLAATAASATDRVVLDLRESNIPAALAVASLAGVLPPGLTPLPAVEVCAAACDSPVFLHPGTLEAVAMMAGGGRLHVRPGATRASARSLRDGAETVLPVVTRSGEAEIDASGVQGPAILRLAGWAGGEAGFTAGVDVTADRILSLEEILAAHQAAAARQALAVRTLVATGSTVLTFQVPGLVAPMTVTAETVLYRRDAVGEIEQRDLRLNGAPVGVGADGVPRLPLVQPERVASPPLAITLGDSYRYRLDGEDTRSGVTCYVVAFEPAGGERTSYRGRAWIAKQGFALLRIEATQTGLRGAIVSSRQEDEFRPVDIGATRAWLLARSDVEQMYEGPGHRTPIWRRIAFDRFEANAPDFDDRLQAARASPAVMMRETAEGFRYLRRRTETEAASRAGDDGARVEAAGVRTLAGQASRIWSVAVGTLFDPNVDRPLPFAGLSYLDLDVLGTGAQMSAFLAGPFAQVAVSVPSVGGPGLQIQAWAFAALARYNDRSFRLGREQYDENLAQRPLRASVAAVRRLGARARVRAAYDLDAVRLGGNDTTAADFVTPASPVAHGARLALEGERGAWSATAWGSAFWRQEWRAWGRPGDFAAEARDYQRAGLTLTRSFVLSRAAVARIEATALAGHDLDRFSRFGFDAFDSRLRGYPSAGVRFDRGAVLRTAGTWAVRPGLRLAGFVDGALVRDPTAGTPRTSHLGLGAAVEAALPGRILLSADWGFGVQARDREGRTGTHVLRITAYKVL